MQKFAFLCCKEKQYNNLQLPLSWTNHTYWQIFYPKTYFYIPRLFAHCDGCDCLYLRSLNKMLHFIKQQVTWKDFVLYFLLDTLIHGDYFLNLDIFASHTKDVQFRWWHFRYYLCFIFFVCTKICEMLYISWEYFYLLFTVSFQMMWNLELTSTYTICALRSNVRKKFPDFSHNISYLKLTWEQQLSTDKKEIAMTC